MAVTEKEPYFNIIEMNFQKSHKYLKKFFERVLPKNVILIKTKKHFFDIFR